MTQLNDYEFGKIVALVETSIKNDTVIFNELKELKEMINSQNIEVQKGKLVLSGLMTLSAALGAGALKLIEKIFL